MVDGEQEIQEHEEEVSSQFDMPSSIANTQLSVMLETAHIPTGDIPTVSALLSEQGFDTVIALSEATVAMLVEYCTGIKPGTALSLIAVAKREAGEVSGTVIAPPQPNPSLIDSNSERMIEIEKRRLAGEIGVFPILNANHKECAEKVSSWATGVAAHTRIWCADGAATLTAMIDAKTSTIDNIIMLSAMPKDARMYMGNMLMKSVSNNANMQSLIPKESKDNPDGINIMGVVIKNFLKKDSQFIASLRQKFIGCTGDLQPTDNKALLKSKFTTWSCVRQQLIDLGQAQHDDVVKDSLKLLLSKYSEISGDSGVIKLTEVMLAVEVGLTKLLEITERYANDWVNYDSIKVKVPNKVPNPNPNPKPNPNAPHKVNTVTVITPEEHCGHWILRGKCIKGGDCKFKHEEPLRGAKNPEMVAHFKKNFKCKHGAACQYKDTTCMFGHDEVTEK